VNAVTDSQWLDKAEYDTVLQRFKTAWPDRQPWQYPDAWACRNIRYRMDDIAREEQRRAVVGKPPTTSKAILEGRRALKQLDKLRTAIDEEAAGFTRIVVEGQPPVRLPRWAVYQEALAALNGVEGDLRSIHKTIESLQIPRLNPAIHIAQGVRAAWRIVPKNTKSNASTWHGVPMDGPRVSVAAKPGSSMCLFIRLTLDDLGIKDYSESTIIKALKDDRNLSRRKGATAAGEF